MRKFRNAPLVFERDHRALVLNPERADTGYRKLCRILCQHKTGKEKTENRRLSFCYGNRKWKEKDVWRLPVGVDLIVGREGGSSNIAVSTSNQISKQHVIASYSKNDALFHIMDILPTAYI